MATPTTHDRIEQNLVKNLTSAYYQMALVIDDVKNREREWRGATNANSMRNMIKAFDNFSKEYRKLKGI